tara:strand:+ start:75 stop:581 length:507 start_codon:yes stop_codon:yes gene_type:complete
MKNLKSGFTLIELIMVTIILGILAAVAIPRYMSTVTKSEEAAEDAVISSIKAGLENVALNSMMENGRRVWSRNPFDNVKIDGYVGEQRSPWQINDHEWSYFVFEEYFSEEQNRNITRGGIVHRRGDNSVWYWRYTNEDRSEEQGDDTGEMSERLLVDENTNEIPYPVN